MPRPCPAPAPAPTARGRRRAKRASPSGRQALLTLVRGMAGGLIGLVLDAIRSIRSKPGTPPPPL